MFITPDDPRFTLEECLRMGGRRTLARVEGDVVHVTTVMVRDFDGELPIYEVRHVSFLEPVLGQRDVIGQMTEDYIDLELAMLELVHVHHSPPMDAV